MSHVTCSSLPDFPQHVIVSNKHIPTSLFRPLPTLTHCFLQNRSTTADHTLLNKHKPGLSFPDLLSHAARWMLCQRPRASTCAVSPWLIRPFMSCRTEASGSAAGGVVDGFVERHVLRQRVSWTSWRGLKVSRWREETYFLGGGIRKPRLKHCGKL